MAWLVVAGCSQRVMYPAGLQSDDPAVCIRAIKVAGDRGDRAAMPVLVQRLEDEDEAVRLFAILALEKITGTRLGYEYRMPAAERSRAIKRWQNHLQTGGPATQPARASAQPRQPAMP